MKVLAIIDIAPGADLQRVREQLGEELRGSWDLYTKGVLREVYATPSPTRVVFVLEAKDAVEAERHLASLPLVVAGQMKIELVELRPFANWARLFAQ